MVHKKGNNTCPCTESPACTVEAVVTIDARGQMVLPKEIRDRASIRPGDRLVVVFWETKGDVCCITLIKNEHFNQMAASLMTPMTNSVPGPQAEETK
jgi:antitoxin PrlF